MIPQPLPRAVQRRTHLTILAMGVVVMLVVAGIIGHGLWRDHRAVITRTTDVANSFALTYKAFTEQTLGAIDASLLEVATIVSGRAPESEPANLSAFLRLRRNQTPLARDMVVVDADGVVSHWTGLSPPPRGEIDRLLDHFRSAETLGPWVSPVFPAPNDPNRFVFLTARPVLSRSGGLNGAVIAVVDQAYFSAAYTSILEAAEASIALIHFDGTVMLRLPQVEGAIGRVLSVVARRQGDIPERNTFVQTSEVDNIRRIIAERRVSNWPLITATTISVNAALAPWRRSLAWSIGVLVMVGLGLAGLTLALRHQVLRLGETQDTLARQNMILSAQQETSTDGILVVDTNRSVLSYNQRFCDLWLIPESLMYEPDTTSLLATLKAKVVDHAGFAARINALYDNLDEDEREGTVIHCRDGRVLERYSRALRTQGAAPWGRVWFYRDVTALRRQEATLRQAKAEADAANAAKTRFLAVMSHEIRTPMTAVRGAADLLASSGLSKSQADLVSTLTQATDTLMAVLNDVLDLSKVESGRMTLETVDFDLRAVMQAVTALFRPTASNKGLFLTLDWAVEPPPALRGDPTRLRQILFNLIANALKFTQTGGVTLRLESCHHDFTSAGPGHRLTLAVIDSGIGIPRDQIARLFEPFTQADEATTRRYGGTGLGLTITQRLVSAMNGTLSVESEPGRGSTFRVSLVLPTGDATRLTPPETESRASTPPFGRLSVPAGTRLLLAEDAPASRMVIATVLTRMGFRVDEVETGQAALDAVLATGKAASPDGGYALVLMDMQMPEMDGMEATRTILAQMSDPPPILGLTADALAENRSRYLDSGLREVLTKPVQWTDLEAALARHIPGVVPADTKQPDPPDPPSAPDTGDRAAAPLDSSSATAEEPSPDPPLFDPEILDSLRDRLGEARMLTLVGSLDSTVDRTVSRIADAAARGDLEAGRLAGHALKGVAAQFGAPRLARLGANLQNGCPDQEHLVRFAARLPDVVAASRQALRDWLDRSA